MDMNEFLPMDFILGATGSKYDILNKKSKKETKLGKDEIVQDDGTELNYNILYDPKDNFKETGYPVSDIIKDKQHTKEMYEKFADLPSRKDEKLSPDLKVIRTLERLELLLTKQLELDYTPEGKLFYYQTPIITNLMLPSHIDFINQERHKNITKYPVIPNKPLKKLIIKVNSSSTGGSLVKFNINEDDENKLLDRTLAVSEEIVIEFDKPVIKSISLSNTAGSTYAIVDITGFY
ncbi:MAG: hypothetical protein DA328_06845 [Nitrososphaeraceae archaeon]|nr:hypothetical protein [Nitrososphaeraceae archaeon]